MKDKGYKKALYLYNNGKIKEAIEICEKEISRDLTNSKVLNLKGLLLYLKGDLEDAIDLWKINKVYNNDKIAITYIKDADNDINKFQLYSKAKDLIEDLAINEAIEILEVCSYSDFNYINVNNALAICYLRKGDNVKAKQHLDKVFKLDKYNEEAKLINKSLESIYNYKNKKLRLYILFLTITIVLVSIIVTLLKRNEGINFNSKSEIIEANENSIIEKNEIEKSEEYKSNNEVENEVIKELSIEDVTEKYITASSYYEEGNYVETKDLLENILNKSNITHLDDDIIFLLASSYESIGDIKKAIDYYDKYIIDYKEGSYIQEVYYRSALLYKNIDVEKSKKYANEIIINYPNSIYNNSYVEEIIKL